MHESTDFVSTNSNGDYGLQETSRSNYTCTFCNMGFSNAQALGGHLNVHRKDRARLQESVQQTLITTTQATKAVNLNSVDQLIEAQSSDDDDDHKRQWTLLKKDSHGAVVNFRKPTLQLSLWIEPSSTPHDYSTIGSSNFSSLSSSPTTEVDLELRLWTDSETTSSRDHVVRD